MRLLLLPVLLLCSCSAMAQRSFQLSPDEFEKGFSGPKAQLLDVRTAGEYRKGHIKDALQADWNSETSFRERVQHLRKSQPLYVYCASGGRSKAAAAWLRSQGFTAVYELKGGMVKWNTAGKPTEGMPDTTPLSTGEFNKLITTDSTVLVDVGASWCPPCRRMAPVIEQLQTSLHNSFKLVKVDAGTDTAVMQQLQVNEIPVFIVYKAGKEVWRKQGLATKEELQQQLER